MRQRYSDHKYHLSHKNFATQILQNIEKKKGKTNPQTIRLADEYSQEILGWIGYAPWLHVYCAVAGSFREGWIPDNYYGRVVVPRINGDYGRLSEHKILSRALFQSQRFPDVAYLVRGRFFSHDMAPLSDNEVLDSLFAKSDRVVFKLGSSIQGKGVHILARVGLSPKDLTILGDGVFQSYIQQNPFFDNLMPYSVATLRITSAIGRDGEPSLRAAYLRIGRANDSHVKSASHVRIPLDRENGELASQGYLPDWTCIDHHPDSRTLFAGKKVIHFDKCVSTALELHRKMPHAECIGWDLVVDTHGEVCVMEWNGFHNDIKFSEATVGPCFIGLEWDRLWRRSVDLPLSVVESAAVVVIGEPSRAANNL